MKAATVLNKTLAASLLLATASLASLTPVSAIAPDPPPVSPSQGLSTRKAPTQGDDEGPWPPLATLANLHTNEMAVLDADAPSPERWSALLRDRVTGASVVMAPPLIGMLRRLCNSRPGVRVELVSGFRSPKLNEVLRKKGHRVASHSQHSLGHAVDFRLVGMTPRQMRDEVRALGWKGGVGQYDKPSDRFIHIDVGKERNWHER